MFRLCFSLLTKCCVGCDGGVENGEDIGSDCDDDIYVITYLPFVKIFREKKATFRRKQEAPQLSMKLFYQFVLRAAVNIDLRCLAVSQTSSENLA